MKKTFKLSVPYLGKAVVVTVVSFSCAISAYQLYQNSSIFSPQGGADNFLDQKEQGEEKHGIYGTRKRTSSRPI